MSHEYLAYQGGLLRHRSAYEVSVDCSERGLGKLIRSFVKSAGSRLLLQDQ